MKGSMGAAGVLLALALAGCSGTPEKAGRDGYREITREGQVLYCRTEKITGSRVSVREICLTRKQMEQAQSQAQEDVRRLQSQPFEVDLPDTEMGAF